MLLPFLLGFASASKIDLSGDGWTLTSPGNSTISVPAWVPSENYQVLQAAEIIQDPLYGFQEDEQAWVRYSNWTWSRPLPAFNTSVPTYLVFEGLDTYTTVSACNKIIGTTDNQFLQFVFDITNLDCSNGTLEINFGPAENITHAVGDSANFPSGGDANFADSCNDSPGHELSCKAWARKEQSDFGWDWSPHLVPAGPWRNISIVQDDLYVNNVAIDIYRQGQMNNLPPDQSQPWVFNASLDFVGHLENGSTLALDLSDSNGVVWSGPLTGITSNNMTITGSTIINSPVRLWWPNAMGAQNLYTADVTIVSASNYTVTRRVGFRTIVLNLNNITDSQLAQGTQPGSNFHFEINGQPFYAKGANMVPLDIFWPRVNTTTVSHLFEIALESNFNMFRVWASGAYLADWIYDLADEMGILLWSEFEFGDAEYPANDYWEAVYQAEAYYNVRRLNSHPSLALWVGGNELEQVQIAFFFNATNPGGITLDYEQTFLQTLITSVYANTKSISYIPSSTYHGYLSLDFNATRPQTPRWLNTSGPDYLYSDTDFYNSYTQAFNLSSYPAGRFAVEFGSFSMPGIESWDDAGPNITSFDDPVIVYHNQELGGGFGSTLPTEEKSILGIQTMTDSVRMYYPQPNIADARANFTAWIWSSQVFQADNYAFEIAFWRRGSGLPNRNLGSLYWQFNDVWTAPTFSSITTNLKPKILQYTIKDIYKPVIVRAYPGDDLEVWVTSDQFDQFDGTVNIEWMTWEGESVSNNSVPVTVGPVNSTMATSLNMTSDVVRLSVGNGTELHSSWYSGPLVNATLQDPQLTLTQNGSSFTVSAPGAVAGWVTLDHSAHQVQGYWSDNGFWMRKGEQRVVTFTVWNDWTGDGSWVNGVTVRSMWDNVANREYAASISA